MNVKILIVFCLMAVLVMASDSEKVVPCSRKYCSKIKCQKVDYCVGPNQIMRWNGFCCCPTCYTYSVSGQEEYCSIAIAGLPPLLFNCKTTCPCEKRLPSFL